MSSRAPIPPHPSTSTTSSAPTAPSSSSVTKSGISVLEGSDQPSSAYHPPPLNTHLPPSPSVSTTSISSSSSSSHHHHLPFPTPHVSTSAALISSVTPPSSSDVTPTTVYFDSSDGTPTRSPALIDSVNSDYDSSSAFASLSKAELIAQLQVARMQAAHEAEMRRQREDGEKKSFLEAQLAQLTAAVASKAGVESMHAQVAAELASRQASHAALEEEIRRLSELIEAERTRKDLLLQQQQMEVTALKVKLEAERLDQEHKARLLAARIAAVKMEIQDRKAKYRARKQADLARQAQLEDARGEDARVEAELHALRKQREMMETEQLHQKGGTLKSFILDSLHPLTWPGSPANPWHEPEACIRHVLRVDADFNIIAQPDHRRVRIKQWPCGKGGMRLAYFCEDITIPSHPFRLIAKESIYVGAKANSLSNFYNDVRSQLVARTFAERFNALSPPKFIQFLLPMIYEFPFRPDVDRRYMAVELYLEGSYIKYSDNVRYVNSQFRTIPAFCHWSYVSSGGQMMITDLQGVNYILTDPQIHSVLPSAEFGLGGGDEAAMVDFFKEHRCNEICHALGLKEHPAQIKGGGVEDEGTTRVGTQYASEVIAECGHLYILQVHQRAEFNACQGKMLCPDCRKNPQAISFFPSER